MAKGVEVDTKEYLGTKTFEPVLILTALRIKP